MFCNFTKVLETRMLLMMNLYRKLTLVICLILFTATITIAGGEGTEIDDPTDMLGVWMGDNEEERFEIYKKGDLYFGKMLWTVYDDLNGNGLLDGKNPNPEKRDQSIIGMDIFIGFQYKGNGNFVGGKVYDPGSGKTYSCKIKIKGDTAEVRGYILIPLLGRTEIAFKYKG